jgi:hypothetical protein
MGVYAGKKLTFPNYGLFAFEARERPVTGDLIGVSAPDRKGWEQGLLIPLANDGLEDPATGIRGWNQKADVGSQPVGQGLFYMAENAKSDAGQTADLALMRWTGDAHKPFASVTAQERDALAKAPAAP